MPLMRVPASRVISRLLHVAPSFGDPPHPTARVTQPFGVIGKARERPGRRHGARGR